MEKKYRDRKDESKWEQTSDTDEEKKYLSKFDSSTDKDQANIASHKHFWETHRQKRYILNLRKHFLSLRRREMNSLEVSNVLHHLSVWHAGIYPTDRLPSVWTRSTAIVANTDDHDRPGQHWVAFYINKHETGTYFNSYGLPPLDPRFFLRLRRNSTKYRRNTTTL